MMAAAENIADLRSILSIVAEETGALKMEDADEDSVGWTTEGPLPMTFGHVRRAHAALAALEAALSAQVQDAEGLNEEMALAVALDFADNPRPYHTLQAPADTNCELYRALKTIAAAYRSAQVQDVAGAETTTRFHIEWIAGARPPVHPNPMTGRTTFESFERAVQHMKSQAYDAQFVSLEERRTTIVHIDRSADMRAALPAAPSQQEASHVTRK